MLSQDSEHLRRILERCLTCDRKWIHGKISCWLKLRASLSWPQQCTVGKHGGLDAPLIKLLLSEWPAAGDDTNMREEGAGQLVETHCWESEE